jgi:hypothetical protein
VKKLISVIAAALALLAVHAHAEVVNVVSNAIIDGNLALNAEGCDA